MNIGAAIKKIRQEKSISQGDLANRCDLSQTSLSLIESGVKRPSSKNLTKICKALKVPETIIYLYGLEETDIPAKKKDLFKVVFPGVKKMIENLLIDEPSKA